jgi:hypothetical protein
LLYHKNLNLSNISNDILSLNRFDVKKYYLAQKITLDIFDKLFFINYYIKPSCSLPTSKRKVNPMDMLAASPSLTERAKKLVIDAITFKKIPAMCSVYFLAQKSIHDNGDIVPELFASFSLDDAVRDLLAKHSDKQSAISMLKNSNHEIIAQTGKGKKIMSFSLVGLADEETEPSFLQPENVWVLKWLVAVAKKRLKLKTLICWSIDLNG